LVLALSLALCLVQAQSGKKCRAVALQGGGDRGAYEAGVLYGFVTNAENPSDFAYDVVTGISAGSINSLAMMIYPKGEELNMVEFLNNSWLATAQNDVFTQWPGGYLQGMFFEPSLVDNDPELTYLKSQIYLPPNLRQGVLVTTDINTAAKVIFTEQDWESDSDFAAHVALFSSAIPFLFKYRSYPPFTFIDGGWCEGIDIEDAVLKCREMVSDDENIIVDAIYCTNSTFFDETTSKYNGLQMYFRGQDITAWRKATFIWNFTAEAFPNVNFRYFVIPSHILPDETLPLDFKPVNMEYMINLGIQDALTAMKEGEGVGPARMTSYANEYVNNVFYNKQTPEWVRNLNEDL